jgi:hypothetical protein
MSDIRESFKDSWKNLDAFSFYDEKRAIVSSALGTQISDVLSEYYPDDAVLVEIGSGNGAMSHYAGETTTSRYRWIETEQNPTFVASSRSSVDIRVAASSADLPFKENSIDGVIGLGMLDTLSPHDLDSTAKSVQAVLKSGGHFAHLLDMSPDYMAEVESARANMEFPVPYNEDQDQEMGLVFINIKNRHIFAKIKSLPEDPAYTKAICTLIEHPETISTLGNRKNILPLLGSLLVKHGLVTSIKPNWVEYLGEKLEDVFSANGLNVIRNETINTSVTHSRSLLPPKHRSSLPNHVTRKQGVVSVLRDETDLPRGQVLVEADAHLFVAEKA